MITSVPIIGYVIKLDENTFIGKRGRTFFKSVHDEKTIFANKESAKVYAKRHRDRVPSPEFIIPIYKEKEIKMKLVRCGEEELPKDVFALAERKRPVRYRKDGFRNYQEEGRKDRMKIPKLRPV